MLNILVNFPLKYKDHEVLFFVHLVTLWDTFILAEDVSVLCQFPTKTTKITKPYSLCT